AHEHDALKTELRADRRRRNAMHAGAGFRDDALFAHAPRQHDLAEHVVHLVRTGVIEILALEIDFRAAEMLRHALREIEGGRTSDVMREMPVQFFLKGRVFARLGIGLFQIKDQRHQRLGDEAAAINAEMPGFVGTGFEGVRLLHGHALLTSGFAFTRSASRAARTKARILSGSFSPGARSTPDDTSTAGARVTRIASATLPASSPPDSMNGTPGSRFSNNRQSKVLPSPPGRVASRGARASNKSRSAMPA